MQHFRLLMYFHTSLSFSNFIASPSLCTFSFYYLIQFISPSLSLLSVYSLLSDTLFLSMLSLQSLYSYSIFSTFSLKSLSTFSLYNSPPYLISSLSHSTSSLYFPPLFSLLYFIFSHSIPLSILTLFLFTPLTLYFSGLSDFIFRFFIFLLYSLTSFSL